MIAFTGRDEYLDYLQGAHALIVGLEIDPRIEVSRIVDMIAPIHKFYYRPVIDDLQYIAPFQHSLVARQTAYLLNQPIVIVG